MIIGVRFNSPAMPIWDSLGNRASAVDRMNETKVNQTVQTRCSDKALKAVDMPIYPLPATRTYLIMISNTLAKRARYNHLP
jgi:hypothetical protein